MQTNFDKVQLTTLWQWNIETLLLYISNIKYNVILQSLNEAENSNTLLIRKGELIVLDYIKKDLENTIKQKKQKYNPTTWQLEIYSIKYVYYLLTKWKKVI